MTYDPRTPERTQPAQGFVIPTCECGHVVGDHVPAAGNLHVYHGPCYQCGCLSYREAKP